MANWHQFAAKLRQAHQQNTNSTTEQFPSLNSETQQPTSPFNHTRTTLISGQVNNHPKTTVVHCKKSRYDVYIGRPSDWGNPFVIGKHGNRAEVIEKYRNWIMTRQDLLNRAKTELRGKIIACWCKPEACHGDILAEIADAG